MTDYNHNPEGKGGFKPGHKRGGRPKRATEERYLRATVTSCPLRRWRAICKKAVEMAEAGDAKARRFLADMLVGRDPVLLRHLAEQVEKALAEAEASNVPGSEAAARSGPPPGTNGVAT
jgi:hypothetical protein